MRKKIPKILIKVDRRSSVELEVQIAKQIQSLILNHQFYDELLSIDFVTKITNVPRKIVVKGFGELVNQRLYHLDEKGNYTNIYEEKTYVDKNSFMTIEDYLKYHNFMVKMKTIKYEEVLCDQKLSNQTGFLVGDPLVKQTRIFYGNDIPKAVIFAYISKEKVKNHASKEEKLYKMVNYPCDEVIIERLITSVKYPNMVCELFLKNQGLAGFYLTEHIKNKNGLIMYVEYYLDLYYTVHTLEEI